MSPRGERILVLATSYPAADGDPSGHFVRSHALELARGGAEVHVVAPGPQGRRSEGGLVVHRLGGETLFGWPGAWERARRNPARLAVLLPLVSRQRRALAALGAMDRVVAHWMVPTALPFVLGGRSVPSALRHVDLELVSHGADVRLLIGLPSRLRHALVSRLAQRARTITFVSRSALTALLASIDDPLRARLAAKSRVRPCPIEMPHREALRDPRPRGAGDYAVWVGRDVPQKRLDLALSAAREAGVPLVVVGSARDERVPPEPDVTFLGPRPRDEALAWIAHAFALLSTSEVEAAPTAAREARALGVPVVACPAGDLAHWAERDPGIRVVEPSARSLGLALRGLRP